MADIIYKVDDRYGICVHIDGCARAMRIFSSKLQNEIVERNANLYPGKNGPYSIRCM